MEQNENTGDILIYQSENGLTRIDVRLEQETVWLTQQQMTELFQTSRTNVVEHIQHIYEEGELSPEATCRNFRQVQKEGSRIVAREMPFYNLDMIISLGYRVRSVIATRFRQWAALANSSIHELKHSLVKGTRSCYAFPTANSQRLGLHWGPQVIEYCTAKAA